MGQITGEVTKPGDIITSAVYVLNSKPLAGVMTCDAQVMPSEQDSEISGVERQCLNFFRLQEHQISRV